MGIREGARPKTQAEIERDAELEQAGRERDLTKALTDPIAGRERSLRENAEREQEEKNFQERQRGLFYLTKTTDQREALLIRPNQRSETEKAILAEIGIFQ